MMHKFQKLTQISFFKDIDMTIKSICVNQYGFSTFFISDKNKWYACGYNKNCELGASHSENKDTSSPVLINELEKNHIIQAATPGQGSTVLVSTLNPSISIILTYYSRIYLIPFDIIDLLKLFSKSTKVLSTTTNTASGHDPDAEHVSLWNEINVFKDKTITKITCGEDFTLFLEDNGMVWSCGDSAFGCLGLEGDDLVYVHAPREIEYFGKHKIKIVDIECGVSHSLAIDIDGSVYSWGLNEYGECGNDEHDVIEEPMKIKFFKDFVVDDIKCGYRHSYVYTKDGGQYLFGSNIYNECVSTKCNKIKIPFRINDIVRYKLGVKEIVNVSVGYFNTKIICKM